jgi:3-methyladenine DNA glycosylase AlkD
VSGEAALVGAIRAGLAALADPARAAPMQGYMKSAMPFLGVPTPQRRAVVKACCHGRECADAAALSAAMLALWREAHYREERYAALDLLHLPRHRKRLDLSHLPVLQEMLETGPWWDFNDEISGLALQLLLQRHPDVLKPLLRLWARGDKLWLRRAAMLCQRRMKSGFDAVLLYDCILPSLRGNPFADEFFIRKGMGWALRERTYQAPDEVRAFCREYADRLSPLTKREALRVIDARA